MAEDKKKEVSESTLSQEEMEKKLEVIEKAVSNIDKIRKKQFMVTLMGILVILLVMAVFVASLADFVSNYQADLLLKEITKSSTIITRSPELHTLVKEFNEVFIPEYKKELIVAFEAEMPNMRKEVFKSAKELEKFLEKDVKRKLLERLTKAVEKIEKKIMSKHPDISAAVLDKAFKEVNAHFIEEITTILEKRLKTAKEHLAMLDDSFKKYKTTPEYASLKGIPVAEAENKLIETFLELWIYHLNPAKGAIAAKGGK
jgi:hypothetical protein